MTVALTGPTAQRTERLRLPGGGPSAPIAAQRTAAILLRLALGRAVEDTAVDWAGVLAMALRERLAGVIWLRAGDLIRSAAPADVVDRWRTLAVVIDRRGRERLEALGHAVVILESDGIRPLVLKGMPLAVRLYGDPFVRASDDIDLFIAPAQRTRARRALEIAGWTCIDGNAPWDELFSAPHQPRLYLEVHETLVTDYLKHVHMPPPEASSLTIEGTDLAALCGAAEPAYLAAHLAGHQLPPLLWAVDFFTLWSHLQAPERAAAQALASRVGLRRYLEWAIDLAATVSLAADHDEPALARLGVCEGPRSDRHLSITRHARLAANPTDAARVITACIWPRPIRWDVVAWVKRVWLSMEHRARRRDDSLHLREEEVVRVARGLTPATPTSPDRSHAVHRGNVDTDSTPGLAIGAAGIPSGRLSLDRPDVVPVVREVLSVAGSARVRAAGMSMWPTIENGSLVTVRPLPERLRIGQVILMDWGGRPVLHRIYRLDRDTVYTIGDACLEPDPPTRRADVCALAVAVSTERGHVTLIGSWEFGARSWLVYVASRSRLAMARAWRRLRRRSRI